MPTLHRNLVSALLLLLPIPAAASDFGSLGAEMVFSGVAVLMLVGAIISAALGAFARISGFAYTIATIVLLPVLLLGIGVAAVAVANLFTQSAFFAWVYMLLFVAFATLFIRFTIRYWRQSLTW